MSILQALVSGVSGGTIEVVDLTAPLSSDTPILKLPEPFADTVPFSLEEISRYDDRGPAWYWNNIRTGEHTGTHLDAPVHWVTAKDGDDVSQIPPQRLIAPAAVIDVADRVAADPDFLLELDHVRQWEAANGSLPEGGWLLLRTGWDARSGDQEAFLNADETGPHTPGPTAEAIQFLISKDIKGWGSETIGTDAGKAGGMEPPFPAHSLMHKANRYGLASLCNLDRLPPKGAILIAAPLKIEHGTGSPIRALALVPRQ
jgi:kynurenine formamidase